MRGKSSAGYQQVDDADGLVANLYQRFSPHGASRETIEAVLRNSGNQAPRAVKELRQRYPEVVSRSQGGDASPSRSLQVPRSFEADAVPEMVRIFSKSAGGHVDARVVARESGRVTVSYQVGETERVKTLREVESNRAQKHEGQEEEEEEEQTEQHEEAAGHRGAHQHHVQVDRPTGHESDATDSEDDDDDDPRGFADAVDDPSFLLPPQETPLQRPTSVSQGRQLTSHRHLQMRLDAEQSLGLTAGAIGIFACCILLAAADDIDVDVDSTDQHPFGLWQRVFVCAMSTTGALCVFTAAVCGAVYREGMRIISADKTALFYQWWEVSAVRRGRSASRLAYGAAVPTFLAGLLLRLHASLGGESMALTVAAASMFSAAWLAASVMSVQVEGYHERR